MKKILALLILGIIMVSLLSFERIEKVKAEDGVADVDMPPYLNTDLIVNVSISAFDKVPNIIDHNFSVSALKTERIQVRSMVASMLSQEDYERGWTVLEISLSAYKQRAVIRPTLVEKINVSSDEVVTRGIFGYKISSLYNYGVESFVLYPSSLNQDNDTRESTAKIGWESSEDRNGISHKEILDDLNLDIATDELTAKKLYEIPYHQSRNIKALKVQVPDSIPKDNEELDFTHYTVTDDLSNTIFQWVMDAVGLDITHEDQKNYIKGFYAETLDLERYLPYEYGTGDQFFGIDILGTVTKAVDDVIVKPARNVIDNTPIIKDVAKAVSNPVTNIINPIIDTAVKCGSSIPPCANVISGIALDVAPKLAKPILDFLPAPSAPAPTPPAPPVYPETSEIPATTNTNLDSAPLGFLGSVIPEGTNMTYVYIGVGAIILVIIIAAVLLLRR